MKNKKIIIKKLVYLIIVINYLKNNINLFF